MEDWRVLFKAVEESDMVKRIPRRKDQSLQDYPLYTIGEASIYLAIPESTLRYWIKRHPVWKIADPEGHLLSFRDLAQAYYLEMARKHFNLSLRKMRDVESQARRESKSDYPLLRPNISTFLNHIFMEKPARGKQPQRMVNLTRYGQLAMPGIVKPLTTRFRWTNNTFQLFPWRLWDGTIEDKRTPVMLDPDVMSGKLVITGTRIPVQVIALRRAAGESVPHLAKDYRIPESGIEFALEHLAQEKKAA
ncbi:MAG TPA: DUF433 domain-containing protein [Pyrinomonadaceae bacterium]|nr:DUF433 domain-containing protein [Pyrinomonadaceae bacterium]